MLALPLAGIKPKRTPILIPLTTHLVPLDRSLQPPAGGNFQLPSLLGPGRLVLGPPTSPALAQNLHSDRFHITSLGFRDRGEIDRPNGRSPPST
jgi:hypothetical protein